MNPLLPRIGRLCDCACPSDIHDSGLECQHCGPAFCSRLRPTGPWRPRLVAVALWTAAITLPAAAMAGCWALMTAGEWWASALAVVLTPASFFAFLRVHDRAAAASRAANTAHDRRWEVLTRVEIDRQITALADAVREPRDWDAALRDLTDHTD